MTLTKEGISPETALYIQKQCINCRKFYTEIENNYNVDINNQKVLCSYDKPAHAVYTAMGLKPMVQGRVEAFKHVEDLGFSAQAAKFPVHQEVIDIIQQTRTYKVGVGKGDQSEDEEQLLQSNDDFVVHRVELTDTLIGIALFYQVKIEDIQRANNLDSHQIFHHKALLVPRPDRPLVRLEKPVVEQTEEQIKARQAKQIKLFKQMTNCGEDEARYYMELCGYNIEEAIKEWQMDTQWEKQASTQSKHVQMNNTRKARACC